MSNGDPTTQYFMSVRDINQVELTARVSVPYADFTQVQIVVIATGVPADMAIWDGNGLLLWTVPRSNPKTHQLNAGDSFYLMAGVPAQQPSS